VDSLNFCRELDYGEDKNELNLIYSDVYAVCFSLFLLLNLRLAVFFSSNFIGKCEKSSNTKVIEGTFLYNFCYRRLPRFEV